MINIWLLLLVFFIRLFILVIRRKFDKRWKKFLLIIILLVGILYSLFRFIIPMKPSPDPTGQYDINYSTYHYKHKTKIPNMGTNGNEREIPVHIWTPEILEESSHPVFLFSHGSFGVGISNETLFKDLASCGYIVMSLDHPHHSFFTTLSNGKSVYVDREFASNAMSIQGSEDLEETLYSLNTWLEIRLEDINFILEEIRDDNKNTDFEKGMNLDKIFLSGHSLGGSAVLGIGRHQPENIEALVVLEAPFVKDIEGIENGEYVFTDEEYPLPVLHIYSDSLYGKMDDITTYEMNQRLIESDNPNYFNEHISGVGHIGLTDLSLASPIITDQMDGGLNTRKPQETLLEINEIVIKFLERF